MNPYVGIIVFEIESSREGKNFFREDFYIVYAGNDEQAEQRVRALAHEQETPAGEGEAQEGSVKLRHVVDVAPALYGRVDRDCDLYSRHFASLEDYQRFEMKLGGKDPLQDD